MHTALLSFVLLCLYYKFLINLCVSFSHILQGCFTGTGAIIWLPQCLWSNPEIYGYNQYLPNHNKTQQSMNCVYISWDVLHIIYSVKIPYVNLKKKKYIHIEQSNDIIWQSWMLSIAGLCLWVLISYFYEELCCVTRNGSLVRTFELCQDSIYLFHNYSSSSGEQPNT